MRVHNLDTALIPTTHARPAAAGSAQANLASASGLTERHAAAFAVLGVESVLFARSGHQVPAARVADGTGSARLDALAGDYRRSLAATKDAQPGISEANARHIARYKTIMANRAGFPSGKFSLHTELAGGGAITTHVPASGGAMDPAKVSVSPAVTAAVLDATTTAVHPHVTDSQLADAYGEWS